jgi:prolipoprotein diacylglyceryl transferase
MIIPAPSFSGINIAGFEIKFYALGYLIGLYLVMKFLMFDLKRDKIVFSKDEIYSLGVVVLIAGIVGARLYHIFTSLNLYLFEGNIKWLAMLNIRNGGLGIPGGIIGGALGGYLWSKRNLSYNYLTLLAYTLPNVLIAQSVGRIGNYFNQELYGRPSSSFLKLAVDPEYREAGYTQFTYFHPTFLYEAVACLSFFIVYHLLLKGFLNNNYLKIGYYFFVYGVSRFFVESLRIDPSAHFAGFRLNQVTSLLFITVSLFFLYSGSRKKFNY